MRRMDALNDGVGRPVVAGVLLVTANALARRR